MDKHLVIMFKENTSREHVSLIKKKGRSSYYARMYCGNRKYVERSLHTNDLEDARVKVLHVDMSENAPDKRYDFNNNGFIHIPKKNAEIGAHAELLFVGRMLDLGYEVYKPFTDSWGVDFLVWKDNVCSKVQVKSSAIEKYNINLRNRSGKRYINCVDYLAFVSFTENRLYYIPTNDIPEDANTFSNYLLRKHIL